jgi:hypothetical protein
MFDSIKFLFNKRKGECGKKYRINVPGLRGSSVFHDKRSPKLDMFPDPDLKCINRAAIGRYGRETQAKPFPLMLMRAAHTAAQELYYNPLDYSVTRRVNEEGKARKIYSQRREAMAKVAATLIMHTSLEYGMVGKIGPNGKFWHMSLKDIASHAGVHIARAKRAMRTLKEKGALTISKQYEKLDDKTYEGHNSIRHLTDGFWAMFGLAEWAKHERKKRYKARKVNSDDNNITEDTTLVSAPYKPKREVIMDQMQEKASSTKLSKEIADLNKSLFGT